MDITGLSSYTDYITDSAKSNSGIDSMSLKATDYSNATDDELMDVCKQFESYLLEQTFKEMWKTVGDSDSESSASTSTMVDYYKDEMIKNLSEESTNQNSLGLAQSLYEQMKRNYDIQ